MKYTLTGKGEGMLLKYVHVLDHILWATRQNHR